MPVYSATHHIPSIEKGSWPSWICAHIYWMNEWVMFNHMPNDGNLNCLPFFPVMIHDQQTFIYICHFTPSSSQYNGTLTFSSRSLTGIPWNIRVSLLSSQLGFSFSYWVSPCSVGTQTELVITGSGRWRASFSQSPRQRGFCCSPHYLPPIPPGPTDCWNTTTASKVTSDLRTAKPNSNFTFLTLYNLSTAFDAVVHSLTCYFK